MIPERGSTQYGPNCATFTVLSTQHAHGGRSRTRRTRRHVQLKGGAKPRLCGAATAHATFSPGRSYQPPAGRRDAGAIRFPVAALPSPESLDRGLQA